MKEYVFPLMNLIRLVFIKFNENNPYDIFASIDSYMQRNEARRGMDVGNPKYLNMGWKQVYNRTPMDDLPEGDKLDDIMLHWMADYLDELLKMATSKFGCRSLRNKIIGDVLKAYSEAHNDACEDKYDKILEITLDADKTAYEWQEDEFAGIIV